MMENDNKVFVESICQNKQAEQKGGYSCNACFLLST